jgi:flagellar basal body-associated protein FliL
MPNRNSEAALKQQQQQTRQATVNYFTSKAAQIRYQKSQHQLLQLVAHSLQCNLQDEQQFIAKAASREHKYH